MCAGKGGGQEKVGGESDPVSIALLAGWLLFKLTHFARPRRKATAKSFHKWSSFFRIATALSAPSTAESGLDPETVAGFDDRNRGGLTCPISLFARALRRIDATVSDASLPQLQSDEFWNKLRPQLRFDIAAALHSVGSLEVLPITSSPDSDFTLHILALIRRLFIRALATRLTAKNWLLCLEEGQGACTLRHELATRRGPTGPTAASESMDIDTD